MKGEAYIFLRNDGAPIMGAPAGHVGWGIRMTDGTYFCGSTENSTGIPFVPPHGDNEGWAEAAREAAEMVAKFQARNYDAYKIASVRNPTPDPATEVGEKAKDLGYVGLFNNCLDHSVAVLDAYGVKGLPWPATNPIPSHWLNAWNAEFHNIW